MQQQKQIQGTKAAQTETFLNGAELFFDFLSKFGRLDKMGNRRKRGSFCFFLSCLL